MSRLIDYVAIFGYNFDYSESRPEESPRSKLLQRFPEASWPDVAFVEHQENFCQPCGWRLAQRQREPSFLVQTLTMETGVKLYSAVLAFHEPLTPEQRRQHRRRSVPADDDDNCSSVSGGAGASWYDASEDSPLYAPKCLLLQSRHTCRRLLRACLRALFASRLVPAASADALEVTVARLLALRVGCPPPPQLRLLATDARRLLAPPPSGATASCVTMLFRLLGLQHCVTLVTALLQQCKVVLFSASYCRLADASRALQALLYPFK